ncbi:MAG: hypothetical protein IIC13_05315, partial [SAR324 cluster bacterium]|nr:hypothetical protein [SAR324 cluster bacterium]
MRFFPFEGTGSTRFLSLELGLSARAHTRILKVARTIARSCYHRPTRPTSRPPTSPRRFSIGSWTEVRVRGVVGGGGRPSS